MDYYDYDPKNSCEFLTIKGYWFFCLKYSSYIQEGEEHCKRCTEECKMCKGEYS